MSTEATEPQSPRATDPEGSRATKPPSLDATEPIGLQSMEPEGSRSRGPRSHRAMRIKLSEDAELRIQAYCFEHKTKPNQVVDELIRTKLVIDEELYGRMQTVTTELVMKEKA